MYCKNCGKENEKDAVFCENCGASLENGELKTRKERNCKMVRRNAIVGVLVVGIILIACIVGNIIKYKVADEEQITQDLANNVFSDRGVSISEISISSREKEGDKEKVVVTVTSSTDQIEYVEKYILYYTKQKDGWRFGYSEEYEQDKWGKNPLIAPTAQELEERSEGIFSEYSDLPFDEFFVSDKQEVIDLEGRIATYYYEIKRDSKLRHISGELEFVYTFDDTYEEWEFENYDYTDSYIEEYDFSYSWSGVDDSSWYDTKYQLKSISAKDNSISAEFWEDEQMHQMSGTIDERMNVELTDSKDSTYVIKGSFSEESGDFDGTLYRAYSPDASFYFGREFSYLNLYIE